VEVNDGWQAIGYMKCVVESIARVTLEINGTPGAPEKFESNVKTAHELLRSQPGRELAHEDPFGTMATQASKMAIALARARNEYGSGHGKPRVPQLAQEMVVLALDGGLLWSRWALRRLGFFVEGRPEP
jgi:hypothetical protein